MSGRQVTGLIAKAADCRQCERLQWDAGKQIYRCGIGGGQVEIADMGATFGGIVGEDALSAQATPVLCAFGGPHIQEAEKQMGSSTPKKGIPWDKVMPGDDKPLWETCAKARANGETWDSILDAVERKIGQRVAVSTIIQALKTRMKHTAEPQDVPAVAHSELRGDAEGQFGTESQRNAKCPLRPRQWP